VHPVKFEIVSMKSSVMSRQTSRSFCNNKKNNITIILLIKTLGVLDCRVGEQGLSPHRSNDFIDAVLHLGHGWYG